MNSFKGYWIALKDIWIFSRTCQSFLDTKQPVWIIILEIQLLLLLNWFVCICFRFSHSHLNLSHHGHLLTYNYHTQSSLCIHSFSRLHSYSSYGHLTHTIVLIWSGQFWSVSLVCDIVTMILQCLDSSICVAYCIVAYCSISQSVSQSVSQLRM